MALIKSGLSRYKSWRITFFLAWGGAVFMSGWIIRAVSSKRLMDLGLYISQTVLILAGPPIYAAAEYNILGRLMHYLPMHASLNPGRVLWLFVYLGITVENLTAVGAGRISKSELGSPRYRTGGILIATALILQGLVECIFIIMVATLHRRCIRARMLTPNVRTICFMLYGTSSLVLFRCIFRAVEAFSQYTRDCGALHCGTISNNEWYLYAFEAAPMVLFTYWLNIYHPARYLPVEHKRYLDPDGRTERIGPGWIDKRSKWLTFVDLFDVAGGIKGRSEEAKFWTRPEEWPACPDGSFALGTASNHRRQEKSSNASV